MQSQYLISRNPGISPGFFFAALYDNTMRSFHQRVARQTAQRILIALMTFCLVINALFFAAWYQYASKQWAIRPVVHRFAPPRYNELAFDPQIRQELREETIFGRLALIEGRYVLYKRDKWRIILLPVWFFVQAQKFLLFISCIAIVLFALIAYRGTKRKTYALLQPLRDLSTAIRAIDMQRLDGDFIVPDAPPQDDIRRIAESLRDMLDLLSQQKHSLTQFVSFASHELKTPLMEMSSTLDLAQDHPQYETLKSSLSGMNQLIHALLRLTHWHHRPLQRQSRDIALYCLSHYPDIVHTSYDELLIQTDPEATILIIDNMLSNARTHGQWACVMTLSETSLTISNPWTLPSGDIRQAFVAGTQSPGHGLGLTLIKLLVDKLWRSIQTQQDKGQVSFILSWHPWSASSSKTMIS